MAGIEVFLSYSHADEEHRTELVKHLTLLQRQGLIEPWYDRRIEPGTNVHAEIETKLETTDVFLLLVSPDFVASDYCYDKEMTRAMQRHVDGSAVTIPAILRPCDWQAAPFGELLAAPADGKPVTEHANRDRAYLEIAQAVRRVAERQGRSESPRSMTNPNRQGEPRGAIRPPGGLRLDSPRTSSQDAGVYSDNLTIKRGFTDRQRHLFADEAFQQTIRYFENSLKQLEQEHVGAIEYLLRRIDATSFEAIAYVGGQKRSHCGIWVGGGDMFSRDTALGYSSGGVGNRNSFNEMLHVEDDGSRLYLRPMIGMYGLTGGQAKHELSLEEAADHLWTMFMAPMQ